MRPRRPQTSAVGRFVKLGGLMGRVGASMLAQRVADLTCEGPARQLERSEMLLRNATRIVRTLGEMKGAAMKVGQMLSLHDGLLPPEVAETLATLQREAPRVPFEVMEYEIRGQLPDYDSIFQRLSTEAFAAASIGQVHHATLRDGRHVAVKVQYPLIDEIVRADLRTLRGALAALFALVSESDFEPVWHEVRDHLLEEIDYVREADHLRTLAALHEDVPEILIPRVVDEASTHRVLTMEYVDGLSADDACSDRIDGRLRDAWGRALFEFQLRGLLQHRFLHADPNLANFAFREDGRVVVYDAGCVKRVPERLATSYAALARAALADRRERIPDLLAGLGVSHRGGHPVARRMTDPYVDLFARVLRASPPYTFGEDGELYRELYELGMANLSEAADLEFPQDLVFVNRSLSGHLGNLRRLGATGPWRELILRYVGEPGSR